MIRMIKIQLENQKDLQNHLDIRQLLLQNLSVSMEIDHKHSEKIKHIKDFDIVPDPLENAGENCWSACHENAGKCDWCGTEGLCCRKGWIVNGCDGSGGNEFEHQCILKQGNPNIFNK